MTNVLAFDELAPGAGVSLLALDRGVLSGTSVELGAAAVTPAAVGAVLLAGEANVRYVDKTGSAAGPGSRAQPFLTIQQAINAIKAIGSQSSTNPWVVKVGLGTFSDAFLYEPWVFVVGVDANSVVANANLQQLSPAFGAAGAADSGLYNCTVSTNTVIDFANVASPGAGRFFFSKCVLESDLTITGNNATNRAFLFGVQATTFHFLTVTNITARALGSGSNFFNLVLTCNGTFNASFTSDVWFGGITINGVSATNFATFSAVATATVNPITTGDRVSYAVTNGYQFIIAPDADTQFVFGATFVPGAIHLQSGGRINLLAQALSVPRNYTINGAPGNSLGTNLTVFSGNAFGIGVNFAYGVGGIGMGAFTLAWQDSIVLIATSGAIFPMLQRTQRGIVKLTNGVSPFIPCDRFINNNTLGSGQPVPIFSLKDPSGSTALGRPCALIADVIFAPRATGGGFVLKSLNAVGAVEIGDQGTYSWMFVGPG